MISLKDPSVAEHYDALPLGLQSAIATSGWEESMREIAASNRLHIDQADAIATEVVLVMIGLVDPAEFTPSIKAEARLDDVLAEKVTMEVDEMIFRKIRAELIELYKSRASTEGVEEDHADIESREELLAEIEKPGPVTLGLTRMPGTIKAPQSQVVEKPVPKVESVPEVSAPAIPPPPPPPGQTPIFAKKLEESVSANTESKTLSPSEAIKTEPKKYSTDPYREAPTA